MNLNFKNIVLESIGLIFLVFGIDKLKVASQSEEYMSLFSYDMDKFQSLTTETISSFTMQSTFWGFGACVLGFVIIGLIKFWKKNKKGLLSSLIGFLLVFLLFPLGFFGAGFSNSIINFVGGIITDDFKIKFLINGLLWSLMGIGIIWFALKKENTTHNNTYNPLRRIS